MQIGDEHIQSQDTKTATLATLGTLAFVQMVSRVPKTVLWMEQTIKVLMVLLLQVHLSN